MHARIDRAGCRHSDSRTRTLGDRTCLVDREDTMRPGGDIGTCGSRYRDTSSAIARTSDAIDVLGDNDPGIGDGNVARAEIVAADAVTACRVDRCAVVDDDITEHVWIDGIGRPAAI